MAVRFLTSADRHGISHADALYAMSTASAVGDTEKDGRPAKVFVGHPHPQTDSYIEVLVGRDGDDFVIFHVMELSDLFRHLLQ